MNSNISSSRLKLPLKISGIVFWGLACIGTIVTGVFLTTLNMKVKEQNKQTYRLVQFQVEQYIAAHPKINRSEFEQYLASSRDYLLVEGLQVSIKDNAKDNAKYDVYLSVKDDFDIRKTDPFPPADKKDQSTDEEDQSADEEDQFISASGMQLIIYFKNLEQEIIQNRRYVLIGLFILFSTFGMVLTWVLRSMLTKPFLQMVDTAEKFSSGDTTVRFDETRDDEFAYMASFVNKALDQLLTKHRELEAALEKVQDSESALFEEKERLEVTLHSIGDAVVSTNAQVVVEYLNPAAEILTGWRCEQASGEALADVMLLRNDVDGQPVENPIVRCLREGVAVEMDENTNLVHREGGEIPIADSAAPIRNSAGVVIGAVMVFRDVSRERRLTNQLFYEASHDALTGLYNRRGFATKLKEIIEVPEDSKYTHSLCYLDLDRFKAVNDSCGHAAGDQLLCQIADLFKSLAREIDVVARLGGDEFGIILKNCKIEAAEKVAAKIKDQINEFRFFWENRSFAIGISIGVIAFDEQHTNTDDLLDWADSACYTAKQNGRNQVHIYSYDALDSRMHQSHNWQNILRRALDQDGFSLRLETILPLNADGMAQTEVKLWVPNAAGTLVEAATFMPFALRYHLMAEIDRWVVNKVAEHVGEEFKSDPQWICSVQLSDQTLHDKHFIEYLTDRIRHFSVPAGRLCFSLSMAAVVANISMVSQFIKALKELGCQVSLNNTGYSLSSFVYIKNLEVDYLKIDGSFIDAMSEDAMSERVVAALSDMGKSMGVKTIAEHVENSTLIEKLRAKGIHYVQGSAIGESRLLFGAQPVAEPNIVS